MSLRPAQLVSPSRPPSWTSTQWQLVGAPASSLGQPLHLGWGPLALLPNTPLSPVLPLPGPASLWWGLSLQEPILALPATVKVRTGICPTRPLPMLPSPTPPLRPCSCCLVLDPVSSPQPPHRAHLPGGPVTVTDANLVLGRLLPASFPCIFGPGEDQPLSPEASRKALEAVATEVNSFLTNGPCPASPLSLEEVAMGFVRVANEAMCRPIRALTQVRLPCPLLCLPCPTALLPTPTPPTQSTERRWGGGRSGARQGRVCPLPPLLASQARGHDPSAHVLACFGGAGGQHACAIARALGMDTVHIHRYVREWPPCARLGGWLREAPPHCQGPCPAGTAGCCRHWGWPWQTWCTRRRSHAPCLTHLRPSCSWTRG